MADKDKKTRTEGGTAAGAAEAKAEPQGKQPLTREELEQLRRELQRKFH